VKLRSGQYGVPV
jgi:hypothetical protein